MKNVLSSVTAQAALFLVIGCFALATLLPGCAGQNPSGAESSVAAASTTTTASTTTSITGTSKLFGTILDLNTGNAINNTNAAVSVKLYKDGTLVLSRTAQNNNFYSFSDIAGGIYYLEASDSAGQFQTNYAIVQVAAGSEVQKDLSLRPSANAAAVASYNVVGKLLNSVDRKPIMFAQVSIGSNAFTTNTLEDGTFIIYGLSEGVYNVTFTKSGFNDLTLSITASSTTVYNGTVAAVDGNATDGTGAVVAGKSIGEVVLGPKLADTGSIAGILRNPTTNAAVINTKVNLWYKPDNNDTRLPGIIYRPTTNGAGYLSPKNLPAGWYAITGINAAPQAVLDGTGALVGYTFVGDTVYTGAYLQVTPGLQTPLPTD